MKLYIFTLTFCISLFANSQAPPIEWEMSYGGSQVDEAWCIIPTKDGGYAVAGSSASNNGNVTGNHGNEDFWVIKINSVGTIEWEKSCGGSLNDGAYSIIQTKDDGFAIAGFSNSNDGDVTGNQGDYDFWVIKTDSVGDLMWEKSLGGSGPELAYSIIQTSDGGYAIAGEDSSSNAGADSLSNGNVTNNHGNYDYWVVKLDSIGDLIWEKSLGGSGYDQGGGIIQTFDGGYAVAGGSASDDGDVSGNHGGWDYWIVKLDSLGNIVWQKCYGGSGDEIAYFIIQNPDGSYIVDGNTTSDDGEVTVNYGDNDFWIIKIDSIGNLIWQKSYGGSGLDAPYGMIPTKDGGYSIIGESNSLDDEVTGNHGEFDYWIIKIDSVGNLEWEESLGGSQDDWGSHVVLTSDSEFVVVGESLSDDGDVTGNHGGYDYWIAKLGMTTGVQRLNVQMPGVVVYPSPATGYIIVNCGNYQPGMSLVVYNCLGQVVQQQEQTSTNQQIDVSHLPAGLYMVCVKQGNEVVASGKFVKE